MVMWIIVRRMGDLSKWGMGDCGVFRIVDVEVDVDVDDSECVHVNETSAKLHLQPMIQPEIKTIPNHVSNRTYTVTLVYPGFRCQQEVNPTLTNIADLTVAYAPKELLYDFLSLMTYLQSFEAESVSLESVANRVLDDFVAQLRPVAAQVKIEQHRERGVIIQIVATHGPLKSDI